MSSPLQVRLLGELELIRGTDRIPITAGRLRALLALLALSAGRSVTSERLVSELWAEQLPSNPRRSLHTYVNRLRKLVGSSTIVTDPSGYTMRLDPDQIDVLRFGRLLVDARTAADRTTERLALEAALLLWRDEPFGDIDVPLLQQVERPRLVEAYLTASERRIDLDVEHGQLDGPIEELAELTGRYPLRESLWVRQLRLLDRSGRRAEALERYEQVRRLIADQLGSDPGAALQTTYAALLADPSPTEPGPTPPVPHQLPPDLRIFAGRLDALETLDGHLEEMTDGGPPMLITGPPGVGKTTLVVHWAHRIADQFPDGQLYVNLRGFDPSDRILNPAAALRGFLDAIAPGAPMPTDPDAQAAQFRSLVAGKKLLLVLDNARDSDQVLPLLPGAAGCLVVITSRHQLTGLIAATGSIPVEVEPIGVEDGHRQLIARLGRNRVRDEPAAVADLVAACAGLPLAIALVSARAATQPQLPLSALAAELRETPGGLDMFGGDTASADLRTVFSWSFAALSPAAAAAFRLLGLHPGPDLATTTAAALLGQPVAATRTALLELCRVHLLREHLPGRYTSHDLIASYAAELAADLPPDIRMPAVARMIDHYLHTARTATELLAPRLRPLTPTPDPDPVVTVAAVGSQHDAQAWFSIEHDQLLAMIELAAESDDLVRRVFVLHEGMRDYLEMQAHWYDWQHVAELSMAVAGRIDDQEEEARSLQSLGGTFAHLGQLQESLRCFEQASDLYRRLGDDQAVARVESNLGKLASLKEDYASAIAHSGRALALYVEQDNTFGVNWVRVDLAWFHSQVGDYDIALRYCLQVRQFHTPGSDPSLLAPVWDTEGYVHYKLGDLDRAAECIRVAHDLYRQIGDRFNEADVLDHLGDVLLAQGDPTGAQQTWQEAYEILQPTGHPLAETVHGKIIRPTVSADAMPAG